MKKFYYICFNILFMYVCIYIYIDISKHYYIIIIARKYLTKRNECYEEEECMERFDGSKIE